jgi:hypothetical protein
METKLGPEATLGNLGEEVWEQMASLSPRLRNFLVFTVGTRRAEIRSVICVDRVWPPGLRLSDVGWTPRVRNALEKAGMLADKRGLTDVTFGKLGTVRGLGSLGMLAFSCTLEAAMDQHEALAAEYISHRATPQGGSLGSALRELGDEDWADQISGLDPRFADVLSPSTETIRDRVDALLLELAPDIHVDEGPRLVRAMGPLKQRVWRIRHMTLEETLLDLLRALIDATGTRFDVIADRLGWSGVKPPTLKECAERIGLTRERVRQLELQVEARIPRHEVYMPPLDAALILLERHTPIGLEQGSALLREAGLTRTHFHIPTLLDIARLLNKQTTLRISTTGAGRFLHADGDAEIVSRLLRTARKLTSRSGLSSIAQLQDALEMGGSRIDTQSLERVLRALSPIVRFVDEGWFEVTDVSPERNRLRNAIRRILSVTSPQSVSSIREGIRRVYRLRSVSCDPASSPIVPPLAALRSYITSNVEFALDGNLVSSAAPLDYLQELGETERVMVDVLRSSAAGVLERRSFAEGCVSRGMNENTFNVYTTYSAVLEHIGTDLWKPRGATVDPAAVEAVRAANRIRPRERRVREFEWTEDGRLKLALLIVGRAGDSLVFGCPGPVRRFLAGQEFECYVKGTRLGCGTIGVDDNGSMYGWRTFVDRYGLDRDDILTAEFDTVTHTVFLSIGEDETPEVEV